MKRGGGRPNPFEGYRHHKLRAVTLVIILIGLYEVVSRMIHPLLLSIAVYVVVFVVIGLLLTGLYQHLDRQQEEGGRGQP